MYIRTIDMDFFRCFEMLLMMFIMTCVVSSVKATQNLALEKDAFQTDISLGSELRAPSQAVDGNTDGNMPQSASCAHTESSSNAWWKVDLGKVYAIDEVKIYNRVDCCQSRLVHVELYIGLDDGPYKRLGYQASVGASHTFDMPSAVYGRWVKITRVPGREHQALALCEVEVMGTELLDEQYLMFEQFASVIGTGNPLETTLANTKGACIVQCRTTDKCNAVNFYSDTHACVKFDSVTTTNESNANSFFYRLATTMLEDVSVN